MSGLPKLTYSLCRIVHFTMITASLPAAAVYVRLNFAAESVTGVLAWVAGGGAMIWSLLYMGLHSYSFPVTIRGAIAATMSPILNVLTTGAAASKFFYGAYSIVFVPLLAHILFLGAILIPLAIPPLTRRLLDVSVEAWMAPVFGSLWILLVALAWSLHAPFLHYLHALPLSSLLLGSGGLVLHVVTECQIMYDGSIFSKKSMEENSRLHEAWSGFTAVCLIAGLSGYGIAMIWMNG